MAEKILIIEDDDSIATLTRLQLESRSFLVQIARNGAEGLRQAYAWQPDLVLLDIMMPDMDGWTVCQRLREMNDVPIIFVTAVGQERNIVRGLQLGADDYIIKPFSTKELQARIELCCGGIARPTVPICRCTIPMAGCRWIPSSVKSRSKPSRWICRRLSSAC